MEIERERTGAREIVGWKARQEREREREGKREKAK